MRTGLVLAVTLTCAAVLAQTPTEVNPVLLEVNGEPVHAADISMLMQSLAAQAKQRGAEVSQDQLVNAATERVVEYKLLAQEGRRLGLEPDANRVDRAVALAVQQAGSREVLDANLKTAGTTYERMVENLREMDLGRVYVDTHILPTIEITDQELEEHYADNPEVFKTPEQVRARHILVKVGPDADEAVTKVAQDRAEEARQRVLEGEDFAAVAKEVSECPSASRGGDLGAFTADRMVEPFSEAAFALEPGKISEIVRTSFGFHVIKVEERRPAGTTPLEEIRDRLRASLRMQKVGTVLAAKLTELKDKASIEATVPEAAPPEGK
jgi:peptidyl-prolyl cis-trans isomerase C